MAYWELVHYVSPSRGHFGHSFLVFLNAHLTCKSLSAKEIFVISDNDGYPI